MKFITLMICMKLLCDILTVNFFFFLIVIISEESLVPIVYFQKTIIAFYLKF